jgi:CxxC motif-containing protein (DUF1111 family)
MIQKKNTRWAYCTLCLLLLPITVGWAMQTGPFDPGVRGGDSGAGSPIAGLSIKEGKFFQAGLAAFSETQSVQGTIAGTEAGLGPRFNMDSCVGCHSQPEAGGTSPSLNPQVAAANRQGATNTIPSFISLNGAVREVRFKYSDPPSNTRRDGGVHDLYTIAGRTDASGCTLAQPDFATAVAQNNLIFRIPTPAFGAGLMEAIEDSTILANIKTPAVMGVTGHENREGNAGTVTRFGWKAQNKSLLIFAGEAYNVEQGVSNEVFLQEREESPQCTYNAYPEDHTHYEQTQPQQISSDVINFATFMRFLAPPQPVTSYTSSVVGGVTSASISNGAMAFNAVGCNLCHTPSMQTGMSSTAALSGKTANLYSDLLVHHMGTNLADDIVQGAAGPDEFRTAPLWGLGQRIFFLHDGRTSNLLDAIQAHSSSGSEATQVIGNFNALSNSVKQDLLNFLRSL